MSSHNTENETSNRTASASIVYCVFALPQNLKFPDFLPRRIVTFRVSPKPNPNPNPNPNLDTRSGAHYVLSATSVAEDVTWWLGKDGHVTRRYVARVWLSLGTRDFHKKKSDPLHPNRASL